MPAFPGFAQHSELDALDLKPSGEAFIRATRLRGLDRSVAYFDPTRPPPPFEARTPDANDQAARPDVSPGSGDGIVMFISAAVLMVIAYLFVTNSAGLSVSLKKSDSAASGSKRKNDVEPAPDPARLVGLQAILAMKDRREALVTLCRSLLARVVAAEGVLLHKSWTDRDTLRRVPGDHPFRAALQDLVFASERVQFGQRDVTEDEWHKHVERLRALWAGGTAQ